jgi:hypothetical protein
VRTLDGHLGEQSDVSLRARWFSSSRSRPTTSYRTNGDYLEPMKTPNVDGRRTFNFKQVIGRVKVASIARSAVVPSQHDTLGDGPLRVD